MAKRAIACGVGVGRRVFTTAYLTGGGGSLPIDRQQPRFLYSPGRRVLLSRVSLSNCKRSVSRPVTIVAPWEGTGIASRLRVIFLGSPEIAIPSLEALARHPEIDVRLVVTQPDRPAGRGRRLTPPPVRLAAEALDIDVIQPETLRGPAVLDRLRAEQPDLLVVVAFGEILRRAVLEIAPLGCLNVHPSLLPRYRGATPIPAAILNGDTTTGVSIMRLVRELDAGPLVAQCEVGVHLTDTTGSLTARLAALAAEMLPGVVLAYARGDRVPVEQDHASATFTREWTTEDARIDWSRPAVEIERLVRAADPWPVAWTTLDGERLRVLAAQAEQATGDEASAGQIERAGGEVVVQTGGGLLRLLRVQPSGKRAMDAADWWRGHRAGGSRLE